MSFPIPFTDLIICLVAQDQPQQQQPRLNNHRYKQDWIILLVGAREISIIASQYLGESERWVELRWAGSKGFGNGSRVHDDDGEPGPE